MASLTLSKLTCWLATTLGITTEGTVSATGTTVTMIDTVGLLQDTSYWVGGSLWITYDVAGTGAAPEWENSVVSASTSGGTITFSPAMTIATTAGDKYTIAKRRYPYGILKQKINQAIREIGNIEVTNTSGVTIAAAQTEYSLPDVADMDLREVWIQGQTSDETNDNAWVPLSNWYVQKSATGTANILVLPQYSTGYDLKLVYAGMHADLSLATSEIDDSINHNLIIYKAAIDCLLYRMQKVGDDDGSITQQINHFTSLYEEAKVKYPISIPSKKPKLLIPLGKGMGDRFKNIDELT